MKSLLRTSILVFLLLSVSFFSGFALAQEDKCSNPSSLGLDDINNCLDSLNQAKEQSERATKPLEDQLNGIQSRVTFIEKDLETKGKQIDEGYKNLDKQQEILNITIRDLYIKNHYNSPLALILSSNSAEELTQILAYQRAQLNQDKVIITNIALSIVDLEDKKKTLEREQKELAVVKEKLAKVVGDAKAYQAKLSGQIAQLSARQREILSQRLAALNIPLYAYNTQGGCSSDLTNGKNPGFSGGFGFFTYGVPNRVGLNQYGAKGRAEAGQNAQTILSAYYNADYTTGYNQSINIHVTGTNEYGQSFDNNWSIEEYLKHVYEVPTNWPSEVLKAQAIAARSYALAYTNNGASSICPSQSCQVVKQEENSDAWKQAVADTAGIVLTNGGSPIKAWFSSTHGGYIFSSDQIGWAGTSWTKNAKDADGDINSFQDLQSKAYDRSSPWFYCDWGGRSQYSNTAWLKSDEVADIVNTLLLVKADSGTGEHLYQTDKSNPAGTDTWDANRVKDELKKRGINPYNSVSGISIGADFGSGRTSSVNVSGDGGSNSFSGQEFKDRFNLRAPANIQIVGPLYNVERN